MTQRIVLVDDHQIFRQGLRALLERIDGVTVVAEAGDGKSAVAEVLELRPDVVVMDISLPRLNGIEATRRILAELPETRVIALSMHGDRRYVAGMLGAGAVAFVLKENAFEELADALKAVLEGDVYLCPETTGMLVEEFLARTQPGKLPSFKDLTAREREVLQLIAEGHSTNAMATILGISAKTVESHRQHIKEKLKISTVAELTKYAVREGLTSLET
jgi:DNA-binding NarL/FixJ family response regulator